MKNPLCAGIWYCGWTDCSRCQEAAFGRLASVAQSFRAADPEECRTAWEYQVAPPGACSGE